MIQIKVLGTGCANCKATAQLIEKVARENDIPIKLEKVEDIQDIMAHGVMSTPGVVVNGKIAHAGGVPNAKTVLQWLQKEQGNSDCCSGGQCC